MGNLFSGMLLPIIKALTPRNSWARLAFVIGVIIGLSVLSIAIGVWLWNLIMPSVLNANQISFWQMFGLCILGRLIAGGK